MYFTKRQLEVIDFIRRFRARHRLAPTLDEIAHELRITKATVLDHIKALETKGALRRTPHHARSLELIAEGEAVAPTVLPILGTVRPGAPTPPFEKAGSFDLGTWLPDPARLHLLEVDPPGHPELALRPGDLLVIDRVRAAEPGDLCVRQNDAGALSIGVLSQNDGDRQVRGVVVGAIRRYHVPHDRGA